jgi:hypothetical protein
MNVMGDNFGIGQSATKSGNYPMIFAPAGRKE